MLDDELIRICSVHTGARRGASGKSVNRVCVCDCARVMMGMGWFDARSCLFCIVNFDAGCPKGPDHFQWLSINYSAFFYFHRPLMGVIHQWNLHLKKQKKNNHSEYFSWTFYSHRIRSFGLLCVAMKNYRTTASIENK